MRDVGAGWSSPRSERSGSIPGDLPLPGSGTRELRKAERKWPGVKPLGARGGSRLMWQGRGRQPAVVAREPRTVDPERGQIEDEEDERGRPSPQPSPRFAGRGRAREQGGGGAAARGPREGESPDEPFCSGAASRPALHPAVGGGGPWAVDRETWTEAVGRDPGRASVPASPSGAWARRRLALPLGT
jgi:hypothetical protein